jgi:hypothetical protein
VAGLNESVPCVDQRVGECAQLAIAVDTVGSVWPVDVERDLHCGIERA